MIASIVLASIIIVLYYILCIVSMLTVYILIHLCDVHQKKIMSITLENVC